MQAHSQVATLTPPACLCQVATSMFPLDYLDCLSIPEAQPVELRFTFASSRGHGDDAPRMDVMYCGHGRTRQLHEKGKAADVTPHDK